jgi:hypothetical protein
MNPRASWLACYSAAALGTERDRYCHRRSRMKIAIEACGEPAAITRTRAANAATASGGAP